MAEQFVHPAVFRQTVDSFNSIIGQQKNAIDRLAADLSAMRMDLNAKTQGEAKKTPRFVEDIPGPRTPYSYVVIIPFTAADTVSQARNVTIATDGPFIMRKMEAFYRITNSQHALVGRALPICNLPYLINEASGGTGAPAGSVEFSFKITTGGSGRQWSSDWMLGPTMKGYWDMAAEAGIPAWIDRTNTVTVEARPEYAIPANATGDVWFYLHGYQILTPINLTEFFGWHS